jgi:hypothetical protein
MDYGPKLPFGDPCSCTLGATTTGYERFLPHGFQRADILKLKVLPVAFSVEL